MIQPANRVTEIQEYYFSRKLKEVAKLNAEGQAQGDGWLLQEMV